MKWILITFLLGLIIFLIIKYKKTRKSNDMVSNYEQDNLDYQDAELSNQRLKEIEKEIQTDKKTYLRNCRDNYSEYVSAAQQLFPEIYEKMLKIDEEGDPWTKYNSEALQLKKKNDVYGEIKLLKKAIHDNVYSPYSYERLAILYSKQKDFNAAYEVCKKWFDSDYWKLPNMSSTSIKLLERLEKLNEKINNGG